MVQSIDNQTYVCQDLVTMQLAPYFVTRLKKFHDDNTIEQLALAASDRNELELEAIVGQNGSFFSSQIIGICVSCTKNHFLHLFFQVGV